MTQAEAKIKWCPFAVSRSVVLPSGGSVAAALDNAVTPLCLGSDCMAWRWQTENTFDGRGIRVSATDGYCGLAGKP